MLPARDLFSHRKYWASRFGTAPFLPMSREEMEALGWDSCDVIIVTGDAYVDHPSFGMAIVGRVLEAHGFRVGIIAQPDWRSAADFARLGRPNLFFGITAGNMDSMVNRYTSDRRIRSDDAYTPDGAGGERPDRSVIVYAQRAREAFPDAPVVVGGIEASLRRIAHFDYWSEKVRRSILLDAKADLLVYGNGERQIVEIAHRLAKGERIDAINDLRGTAFTRHATPQDWTEIDSTTIDEPGKLNPPIDPYAMEGAKPAAAAAAAQALLDAGAAGAEGRKVLSPRPDVAARALRHSHARLRRGARRSGAVCARLAHPSSRIEPGQRARTGAAARRRRRVAQSATGAAHDERDGRDLRAAVPARAASVLWQREDSRVPDDPLLDLDPARLLRRLHVLLDHRARGPHHPEPLGRFRDQGDREPCATRCRASPA